MLCAGACWLLIKGLQFIQWCEKRLKPKPCRDCGGTGFTGRGTGYDDVCDRCAGTLEEPTIG